MRCSSGSRWPPSCTPPHRRHGGRSPSWPARRSSVAVNPLLVAAALVALGLAVWVGVKRRNMPEVRAISAAISMNVLAWAELEQFFGLTAIVAIAAGALLFVFGMRRRPRAIRRRAYAVAGAVGVLAILSVAGFAVAAAESRSRLETGQDLAEAGISALNRGDFADAADQFERAARSLRQADQQLGRPWTTWCVGGACRRPAPYGRDRADRGGLAGTRRRRGRPAPGRPGGPPRRRREDRRGGRQRPRPAVRARSRAPSTTWPTR